MVELNGGTIRVESTEGKGSIFTVSFPALIKGQDELDPGLMSHPQSTDSEIENIDSKQYV
jgi:hypothetical protein